ncbi:MAG: helix-turn-helix transcriptional regulator [Lachnospiraceae bacterium]|nr:helix-turn-helix transcriptional regulator [Lachnospiraceae bacterium]
MFLTYENKNSDIIVEWKRPSHFPPHIHEAIEMVYITKGTLELGVGQELYHMEKGDFAIVFPNLIHHYQVFGTGENKALYMLIAPKLIPDYMDELQKNCPSSPVICKEDLHVDIVKAVKSLVDVEKNNTRLIRAYVQMIFAHVFSQMDMVEKETVGSEDLVYKSVEYVAKNFREKISLEQMACDLGVSKYVLSRLFSKIFHCNFTGYVNGVRLNYALCMLDRTNESITNICYDCGFESQRTFNRVFKERYRMTPREYRVKKHTLEGC